MPIRDTTYTPLRCGAQTMRPQDTAAGRRIVYVWCKYWSALGDTTSITQPICTSPSITVHPQSQSLTEGNTLNLSVTATGTATLAYQWKKAGSNITGATSSAYSKPTITTSDAGNYTVTVTNTCGTATSNAAVISVATAPATYTGRWGWQATDPSANMAAATYQNSSTFTTGSNVSLSISAMPDETFFYWEFPNTEANFTTYSNDLTVDAIMPDLNFKFVTQGSKKYIVTRGPITFSNSLPLIFKK